MSKNFRKRMVKVKNMHKAEDWTTINRMYKNFNKILNKNKK